MAGSWETVQNWPTDPELIAIHSIHLRSSKVLIWAKGVIQ